MMQAMLGLWQLTNKRRFTEYPLESLVPDNIPVVFGTCAPIVTIHGVTLRYIGRCHTPTFGHYVCVNTDERRAGDIDKARPIPDNQLVEAATSLAYLTLTHVYADLGDASSLWEGVLELK